MNPDVVLERKCRPRSLEQMIGQASIVRTLTNAIKTNKLHHAYLFEGQFGSGKTSLARILAASENCEKSPGLFPCGKCSLCEQIFNGIHADVKEIDTANDAGSAEQIRLLKHEALYNPVDGAKTKYFILEECHRLSATACDSLLKLLEEPPARTRFVLCTTDAAKVRPAIVSRCQRHSFTKIFWMTMAEALNTVAKKEKINIETGAINICAKAAKGSMRSALNYLEKLTQKAGEVELITQAMAEEEFGNLPEAVIFNLFDELLKNDTKIDATKAFRILNEMLVKGSSFECIADAIIEHLNMLVVGMTCGKAAEFIYLTEEGKKHLIQQLKFCMEHDKIKAILVSMERMNASRQWVGYNANPESALRKWFVESIMEFRK